jgi:hypothetical protein
MWTVENRVRYDRSQLRYPSDLTDEEWALAKRKRQPDRAVFGVGSGRAVRDGAHRQGSRASIWRIG